MFTINRSDIIRAGIEAKIKELEKEGFFAFGNKVHIDKDILEIALFDRLYLSRGVVMKVPVWSGDFLSKIDLSEISFRDVAWSFFSKGELFKRYKNNKAFTRYFTHVFKEGKQVIYRNTNAKIDFSESFEALHSDAERAIVENCDFSGTDLSNNQLSCLSYAKSCRFDSTKIDFGASFKSYFSGTTSFCSFKGNALFGMKVNLLPFLISLGGNEENNFSDTGLCFVVDTEILKKCETKDLRGYANRLLSYLKKGYLNRCYLNEDLLPTDAVEQEVLVSRLFSNEPTFPGQNDGPKLTMGNPNMK